MSTDIPTTPAEALRLIAERMQEDAAAVSRALAAWVSELGHAATHAADGLNKALDGTAEAEALDLDAIEALLARSGADATDHELRQVVALLAEVRRLRGERCTAPSACGALAPANDPDDHECDLDPRHSGPHECAGCGATWRDVPPALTTAEAEAERLTADLARLAAWLDEHVPARWHRGGAPVDVAVAMLAAWSDRGALATRTGQLQEVRGAVDALMRKLGLGVPDVSDAVEQAHQLGLRVWELAGDTDPDDPHALNGSVLQRAAALLADDRQQQRTRPARTAPAPAQEPLPFPGRLDHG